jgi:hypothetical protein
VTEERKILTDVRGVSEPEILYGELEKQNAPEYDFFVPLAARWKILDGDPETYMTVRAMHTETILSKTCTEEIGDHLNKALAALQEANLDKLTVYSIRTTSTSTKHLAKTISK